MRSVSSRELRNDRQLLQRGSVTVEFAVLLPVVVLMMALVASVGATTAAQIRVIDAARVAARLAAVGHPAAEVTAQIGQQLPGAEVELLVSQDGLVTAWVSSPGPLGFTLSAEMQSYLIGNN